MATRISVGTVERRSTPALPAVLAPPSFLHRAAMYDGSLSDQSGSAQRFSGIYRATGKGACVFGTSRDSRGAIKGLLSGLKLPPELSCPPSLRPVHPH